MTQKSLRCGNCRADVTFTSPGTLIVVCEHCSYMNARGDVDAEAIGKVAAVTPMASKFQLGTEGVYARNPFVVRGQIQRDHGSGPWNEWAAETIDGDWLWISEAQGQYLVFDDERDVGNVDRTKLEPGAAVTIPGQALRFRVREIGEGKVVTFAGELPYRIEIGETAAYVDMYRGEDEVGTLEWSDGPEPDCYLGHVVELDELALDPTTQPEGAQEEVSADRFSCKHCGGQLEIRDPENAVTVGCMHCGSLLDLSSPKVKVVEAQQKLSSKPAIPLGTIGSLRGQPYMVLGCMQRRVRAEGRWYPWREYLLRTPGGAYHWLIENNGHWQLGRPIQGAVTQGGFGTYKNKRYKHFTSGKAVVHWVLGEFYWAVREGDKARATDYVNGTSMLSRERTDEEESQTLSEHIELEELETAFGGFKAPRVRGVGPVQPNPHKAALGWVAFAIACALAILVRMVATGGHENRLVYSEVLGPLPSQASEEQVVFSEPFELTAEQANFVVELALPGISNGWIGLTGALVNAESGEVTTFATQASYYSGVADGSRWSEGNRRGDTTLGSIPGGSYRLRLAATGWGDGLGKTYQVEARSQVPRGGYLALVIFLLMGFPILNSIVHVAFEASRWSDSDHPWGGG